MSSRPYIGPKLVLSSGSMAGTGVLHSSPLDTRTTTRISMQAIWTGTPVGTFAVEGSLNYDPGLISANPLNSGTWTDVGISIDSVSGVSGSRIIDMTETALPWVRFTYTNTSGTGTLNVYSGSKST